MRNRITTRSLGLIAMLAGTLIVAGCAAVTINEIRADPQRYANRDVKVRGNVVESYSVLGRGAYRLDDGTGELWIVSTEGVPREGARVEASGRIRDGFDLGSLMPDLPRGVDSGLVMTETSHNATR